MHWKKGRLYREYSPLEDRFYRYIAVNLRKFFSHGYQQLIYALTILNCFKLLITSERGVAGRGSAGLQPVAGRIPLCSPQPLAATGRHLVGARRPTRALPSPRDPLPSGRALALGTAEPMGSIPGPGESTEEARCENTAGDR